MANDKMTVHITIDDMRSAFDAIHEHIIELGAVCASQSAELDRQRHRIERLESLPGVAEALAAQSDSADANR